MQKYKEAKKLLFAADKCPLAILNGDDAVGREIGGERSETDRAGGTQTIFYGLDSPSEIFAVLTSEELYGCEFMLNLSDSLCRISLPMTGKHNVYNAMAAAGTAYALGIRTEAIAGGLNEMKPVRRAARTRGKIPWRGYFRRFRAYARRTEKSPFRAQSAL